tara:strand:- start:322 stop:798 length:477 start_codon:yes stop_codon:yes gene_type:complete
MKDELVSFELAKLAKDKGFNEYCENAFDVYKDKNISENIKDETAIEFFDGFVKDLHGYKNYRGADAKENYLHRRDISDDLWLLRPTQSLLQKWLREVHNIHLEVSYSKHWKGYQQRYSDWRNRKENPITKRDSYTDSKTYEEALEKGLEQALKLIENE